MTALLLTAVGGTGRETGLLSVMLVYVWLIIAGCCSFSVWFCCDNDRTKDSSGWDSTYVALAADGLLAVVLGGKGLQGRLNDTTTQTEDKVKGGLL